MPHTICLPNADVADPTTSITTASSLFGPNTSTDTGAQLAQQLPDRPQPDHMGVNHSQGRARAPRKPSLPIPVPRLLSKKRQPSADFQRLHIALDEETIAKALAQTKLPHGKGPTSSPSSPTACTAAPVSPATSVPMKENVSTELDSPTCDSPVKPSPQFELSQHDLHLNYSHQNSHVKVPHCSVTNGEKQQRFNGLSLSASSSSSSLASSGGSMGLSGQHSAQRPSLALQCPGGPLENSSQEEDDEEEEDEEVEDEEEEDNEEVAYDIDPDGYGAALERNLQLRLQASHRYRGRVVMPPSPVRGLRSSSPSPSPPAPLLILPRALRCQFRKVSGMLGTLGAFGGGANSERRAVRRVVRLASDRGSYFGCLVQDYVSFMRENGGGAAGGVHTSALDLLQTVRHFITQMKAYLVHSSELQPPIESFIPEEQIDPVLERAMHKCVLKPLQSTLETAMHDFQLRSGAWRRLRENLAQARSRRPEELGVDSSAVPPDAAAIERIRRRLRAMRKAYSPEQKVLLLLRVCKLIYTVMQDNSGRMFGADDFLPMLTYVLVQCDMPQLDTDVQYMMELLDPALLYGEGGYYLTSAYSAMSLIKNLQEEQAARALSTEARNTLHQWHRRRTAQRSTPTVEDFQNYLRVALQELESGCTSKTLQVSPYSTTEEVCRICALKFGVAQPERYALFLLTDGATQQLAPDTHPQRIKAELHSRPRAQDYHFVYRRLPDLVVSREDSEDDNNNLSDTQLEDQDSARSDNNTSRNSVTPDTRADQHCSINGLTNTT